MQGARADLRKALAEVTFLTQKSVCVANVDAHVHDDPAESPGLLSAQLCSPVRSAPDARDLLRTGTDLVGGARARRSAEPRRPSAACLRSSLSVSSPRTSTPSWTWSGRRVPGEPNPRCTRESTSTCRSGWWSARRAASSIPNPPSTLRDGPPARHDRRSRGSSVVDVGDLMGRVGVSEVRTPFAGQVIRWLAADGERVQEGQPLVWLRVPESR